MAATAKNTAVQTALYKFVLINFDYLRKLFHTSQVYLSVSEYWMHEIVKRQVSISVDLVALNVVSNLRTCLHFKNVFLQYLVISLCLFVCNVSLNFG